MAAAVRPPDRADAPPDRPRPAPQRDPGEGVRRGPGRPVAAGSAEAARLGPGALRRRDERERGVPDVPQTVVAAAAPDRRPGLAVGPAPPRLVRRGPAVAR